jgi:hypothetical protein
MVIARALKLIDERKISELLPSAQASKRWEVSEGPALLRGL